MSDELMQQMLNTVPGRVGYELGAADMRERAAKVADCPDSGWNKTDRPPGLWKKRRQAIAAEIRALPLDTDND